MTLHRLNKGFTLIEVMVVIVIASLMVGILVFGFDQTLSRRKGAAAEEVFQWLQAAADTAVFQSTVIGVAQKEDQLMLLAFYQDDWFKLADQESLVLNEEISLVWSESLLRDHQSQTTGLDRQSEKSLRPYVVIMSSGEVLSEGNISIFDQDVQNSSLNQDNSFNAESALATIDWDEDERFSLSWKIAK